MSEREKIIETIARAICCDPPSCEAPKCGCAVPSENARQVIAALDAAGYAIVKRELDEAMLEAGSTARRYREDSRRDGWTDDNTAATWRAMIAAQEQK